MNCIKEQLDQWTFFHLVGALAITLALAETFHLNNVYASIIGITCLYAWEIADHWNMETVANIWWLDARGASWVDYGLGSGVVLGWIIGHPDYPFHWIIGMIILLQFVHIYYLYSKGYWEYKGILKND